VLALGAGVRAAGGRGALGADRPTLHGRPELDLDLVALRTLLVPLAVVVALGVQLGRH
jgi:hypothetical protein